MIEPYEEVIDGTAWLRIPPGPRHELARERVHAAVLAAVTRVGICRVLEPRSPVEVRPGCVFRPDLAVRTVAGDRLVLVAEVIDPHDHTTDTVVKKAIYEEARVPRLWMVDPRYDNVEVYHATAHGLALWRVLAGNEPITETFLNGLSIETRSLFTP